MAEHGWFTFARSTSVATGEPALAYTTGLCCMGRPELIVTGLPAAIARPVLDTLAKRSLAERLPTKACLLEGLFANVDTALMPCESHRLSEAMPLTFALYADAFDALQLVWPSQDGHFPWDESVDPSVKRGQPLLLAPPYDGYRPPLAEVR